jgi:dehydrogenase/reductase SDR family protein 12
MGLERDVRRVWEDFVAHRTASGNEVKLDALVCNAGALLNEKTLTSEGVEVTFASHFLFGTYLLGSLAMPLLKEGAAYASGRLGGQTDFARLVVVSSGGMYNTCFPDWATATSTGKAKYDGTLAYAYAKRGQVLLCERWSALHPEVKIVSTHPGWTDTPGVEEAFGDDAQYLKPLRTLAEGSEGIIWLCCVDSKAIKSGEFYLDREPQVKHMAGPFFTEGSVTKNTQGEVDKMMIDLNNWANGKRKLPPRGAPLTAMKRPIDIQKFMGRWFVLANIPTVFDKGTINNTEDYTWNKEKQCIEVNFSYQKSRMSKTEVVKQRCTIANASKTEWSLSPKVGIFYIPVGLPYLILDCTEDYSQCIVGVPDRSYLWIMTRTKEEDEQTVSALVNRAVDLGYEGHKIERVPQDWHPLTMRYATNRLSDLPGGFEQRRPHFKYFIEVAPGFFHYQAEFKVAYGTIDLKTHMSVVARTDGEFIAIDAVKLSPAAKKELDELTFGGEGIVAVLQTHPYHTLAIEGFHEMYPASSSRQWFGCPRHLLKFPGIDWAGDLNTDCARKTFEPEIAMAVPAGAEFINPLPPASNHFASVLVLHRPSKTMHVDDTLNFFVKPPRLVKWLTEYTDQTMHFHRSLFGPALHRTPEAPEQFRQWFAALLERWDFENIVTAHTGCCFVHAKQLARELLARTEPELVQLALRNANGDPSEATPGWSEDPKECECG